MYGCNSYSLSTCERCKYSLIRCTYPAYRCQYVGFEGLSEDDVRKTAYEVLLASLIFSGVQIHPSEDKKKENKTKFLTALRSRRDNSPSQSCPTHFELLDMIRIQMEISEAMDACIKQGLIQFASRTMSGQVDVPQISLELLNGICKSDFFNDKSYMQWQKRQANVLEEFLCTSVNLTKDEHRMVRCFLEMLRNTEEWAARKSPSERAEVLQGIKRFASKLSCVPARFGIPGETYYWTAGYHLNVKLYEKLLSSVFDILEESHLIDGTDEILRIIKLTWSTLGITQKMHYALYGWVLFRQFVGTGEAFLLEHAILQMQKVVLGEGDEGNKGAYMNTLMCSIGDNGNARNISLIDAVFLSMNNWCDNQLQDYHLHFSKNSIKFGKVLNFAVAVGLFAADDSGEIKLNKPKGETEMTSKRIKLYVETSIHAAYERVLYTLDTKSKSNKRHPLAILADELKLIAERESTIFSPVLRRWCPESGMLSTMLLHRLYWKRLRPFLDVVSQLSEDVRSVLPAADILDRYLSRIFHSACEDMNMPISKSLHSYQIGEVCGPIVLHWMSAQHKNTLEWTERAFSLEDWEPLSSQQRQAASIVEVLRIIEETVDQFFHLNLPMDIIHLRSLLFGIVQSLEAYLLGLVSQLVDKNHLFPAAPALTRYKEIMNPFMKKKLTECKFLEEKLQNQLNELSTSKLCVRLNTLHYIQTQIRKLEDSIRKRWMLVRQYANLILRNDQVLGGSKQEFPACNESVDEQFSTFNNIRKTADDATKNICDFIGVKVVFWDLRDSFLFSLYRGIVESSRVESILPELDTAVDHICDLIVDTLRDPVVFSICQASLEGYVWVLLDGGPSRAFADTDIIMMQEDLNILKDFFVANGEGLPRVLVVQEAKLAQQILNLYALQTETIVGMLMSASQQISTKSDSMKSGGRCAEDADTLLRVLCHKTDSKASEFLKRQYQLPKSSDYEDTPRKGSTSLSPLMSDLLKRSTSFRWAEGQTSFGTIKKKLQKATSEIKHAAR
ncbi:DNA topoisomerase 4 subunit B (DUF810) isoform X2 [Tasmannia lanceolata]|uniref:DNA topoisomerase 4 subunit B (DUF810) isoform X2 n=1 Tax=Tasmannia lanceolata TaxID=3420 RepID=UPI004063DB7E